MGYLSCMAEFAQTAEAVAVPQKPRIKIPNPFRALASRLKGNKGDKIFQEATIGVKEDIADKPEEITSPLSEFDQVRSLFTESQTQTPPEKQNWSSVLDDLGGVSGIAKFGQKNRETGQDLRALILRHRNIIPGKGSYGSGEVEWIVLTVDGPRVLRDDGTSIMTDAIASAVRNPDKFSQNAGYDGRFIRLGEKGHTVKVEEAAPDINLVGEVIKASIQDAQDEQLYGGQDSNLGLTREENSDTLKVAMQAEEQVPKPEDLGVAPPSDDVNNQTGLPSEVSEITMDVGDQTQSSEPKTLEEANNGLLEMGLKLLNDLEKRRIGAVFGSESKHGALTDDTRAIVLPQSYSLEGEVEASRFLVFTRDGVKEIRPRDVSGFKEVISKRIAYPVFSRPESEGYGRSTRRLTFTVSNKDGGISWVNFGEKEKGFGEVSDLDLTDPQTAERVQEVIQENVAASETPVQRVVEQTEHMGKLRSFVQSLPPRP